MSPEERDVYLTLPEPPSPDEQLRLARRVQAGDLRARDEMVERNIRLAWWVAARVHRNGMPMADLAQEGAIGLIRAVEMFDPDRGFMFATYATHWVRQAVMRAVRNKADTVRLPVHVHDQLSAVKAARAALEAEGIEATVEALLSEVAQARGKTISRQQLLVLLEAEARSVVSLDAPLTDDTDTTLGQMVAAPDDTDAAADAMDGELRQAAVRDALRKLPARQARALELRHGLGGEAPLSLQDVGEAFGVTRERARQIISAAERALERAAPELAGFVGPEPGEFASLKQTRDEIVAAIERSRAGRCGRPSPVLPLVAACLVRAHRRLRVWSEVIALADQEPEVRAFMGGDPPSQWAVYRFVTALRRRDPALAARLELLPEPPPAVPDAWRCEGTVNLGPRWEGRVHCTRKASAGRYCRTHARKMGEVTAGPVPRIGEEEIEAAYGEYQAGWSLREIAARHWRAWGYASADAARSTLRKKFEARGLPLRSKSEGMRARNRRIAA